MPVLFGDFKEAMATVSSKFEQHMAKSSTELNVLFSESVTQCQTSLEQKFAARMAASEAETRRAHERISQQDMRAAQQQAQIEALNQLPAIVHELKQRQDAMEARINAQQESVKAVQSAVSAETEARKVDPTYSDPPDTTLLRLNTHSEAPLAAVQAACETWLGQDFQPGDWEVSGNKRQFTLRSKGL
eukprot:2219576-Karenia_brevis.AAC.1